MPLEDKDWKFALGSVSSARGMVVTLRTDTGHAGYGYAPAIPHMGSTFESLPQAFSFDFSWLGEKRLKQSMCQ